MNPQKLRNTIRHSAAAFGMLLASLFVSSSRVEASCGDYVMIGGQNMHVGMSHGTPDASSGTHDPASPTCHGPLCSNNSLPPAAPTPRIEVVVEQWAIPCGSAFCRSPQTGSFLAETREVPCQGIGLSILRPPR